MNPYRGHNWFCAKPACWGHGPPHPPGLPCPLVFPSWYGSSCPCLIHPRHQSVYYNNFCSLMNQAQWVLKRRDRGQSQERFRRTLRSQGAKRWSTRCELPGEWSVQVCSINTTTSTQVSEKSLRLSEVRAQRGQRTRTEVEISFTELSGKSLYPLPFLGMIREIFIPTLFENSQP